MASGESHAVARSAQPFQFTLRQIILAMACISAALALTVQIGPAGFWISLTVFSLFANVRGAVRGSQSWLATGIAGTVISFWLMGVLALSHPRESWRRPSCQNNLHNIALALLQYHDLNGSFPPAYIADEEGRPMHSWRVLLLPYLDQRNLYKQYRFDEPWDGPNNSKLHDIILKIYSCPSHPEKLPRTDTSYVAVVGPQTMWPGEKATKFSDLKDGSSKTIMLVEVHNSGIHWMEPRDLHVTQMPMTINPPRGQGISSGHAHGAHVGFADGSVRFLTDKTSQATLRAALTPSGGEQVPEP